MIQQTSLDTWYNIEEDLNNKCKEVFETIMHLQLCTNQEIANYLHWGINSVTGRVLELRNMGIVKQKGFRNNKEGRKCMLWMVAD